MIECEIDDLFEQSGGSKVDLNYVFYPIIRIVAKFEIS